MSNGFRVGEWLVEHDLNLISCMDRKVQIEPKVMEVLVYMAENAGSVIPRQKIMHDIWSDTYVTEEALTYSISELRKALGDDAKNPHFIQTIPRRGYRMIAPVFKNGDAPAHATPEPLVSASELTMATPATEAATPESEVVASEPWILNVRPEKRRLYFVCAGIALVAIAVAFFWYLRRTPALDETDLILLTDFVNSTGDPVFDDTLKQALAVHLEQTPFLNIFSEERARETLSYMGRSPSDPITRESGREICLRRGVKAMLAGSISNLGRIYVISLEALNAQTGDVIAREQFEAGTKEDVLQTLGKVATKIRKRLGESINSIERFDIPLEQATTTSLEAFKSYSLGRKHLVSGRMAEALPHYLRAIEFDPNFASAYDDIAWCYDFLGHRDRAAESARTAYSMRDKVSQYEKLSIEAIYHTYATEDLHKAIEVLELMKAIYPRSAPVHNTLGGHYSGTGQLEKAIECFREAIRISRHPNSYPQLVGAYLRLNRLPEAKETLLQARAQGIDNANIRSLSYIVAYHEGDRSGMEEQIRKSAGKPDEHAMLALQAAAAASHGNLQEARRFQQRAIEVARNNGLPEIAAVLTANAARREALFGNYREALENRDALLDSRNWVVLVRYAQALALCGKVDQAQSLAERISEDYPDNRTLHAFHLPVIRAMIQLRRGKPDEAMLALKPISSEQLPSSLWPAYLRGQACLMKGAGKEAEAEFQKLLGKSAADDPFSPFHALAHLGIGKAARLSGELAKSQEAYRKLLGLWKGADSDLPILQQAQAEYARLKPPVVASAY